MRNAIGGLKGIAPTGYDTQWNKAGIKAGNTNTILFHLYVESKKQIKWTKITNRFVDTEKK